jgi:hypothetical protein
VTPRNAAFAAAPFLVIAVLLGPYWTATDRAPTSPSNDIHTWHAPNVALIARGLSEDGELPRWNAQDFGGISLVADPQAGVYNPVHWLLALSDSVRAFGWLIVAATMLGALGFLRYARAIGCSMPAAAVGAVCFALGGSVLFRLVALGHVVYRPECRCFCPRFTLNCLRCAGAFFERLGAAVGIVLRPASRIATGRASGVLAEEVRRGFAGARSSILVVALRGRRPSFSWSLSTVFTAATVVSTSARAPRVPALAATWTPRVPTFDAAFFTVSTSPRLSVAMSSSRSGKSPHFGER